MIVLLLVLWFYSYSACLRSLSLSRGALAQRVACWSRYTVGKVGTGYTVDEVKALNAKLGPVAVPFGKAGKASGGHAWPRWLHPWNMKADDVPDVWVPPHESVVVEIKCAEVVDSDQFSALKTPRFPRCENLRYDKVL